MAKYISGIDGVKLQASRGDTISRLAQRIASKQAYFGPFDYVLIHVGTNDIGLRAPFQNINKLTNI